MSNVRPPAVAGLFYPSSPNELRVVVDQYLAAVPASGNVPKAVIAPHAGYIYSGPIAASVYARVKPARDIIRKVVLLGPAHRVDIRGLAFADVDSFETPLGTIPIDRDSVEKIRTLQQVQKSDVAHAQEHSLEVHLPFLQRVLSEFTLVPLAVGRASPEEVGEVLERIWGGPETLIVISSDLSHYHDYDTARQLDQATSRAIETLNPDPIGYEQACGRNPINGLLKIARSKGMHAHTVDLRNSGDTAGPRDRVVGYGAYIFG